MQSKAINNGDEEPRIHSQQIHEEQAQEFPTNNLQKVDYQSAESTSEPLTLSETSQKRVKLPPRPKDLRISDNHVGKSPLLTCRSSGGNPSTENLFCGQSSISHISIHDERSSLLNSGLSTANNHPVLPENARFATHFAKLAWKRCLSLPVKHGSKLSRTISSSAVEVACSEHRHLQKGPYLTKVSRSLSVPTKNVVILRSKSFSTPKELMETDRIEDEVSPHLDDGDEEIPEEDAVCRVCLEELCVDRSSLKLECSCKGALSLMHEECALKWFTIKGNKNCDVCGQEILNLPVTLFRMQSSPHGINRPPPLPLQQIPSSQFTRPWQDVVVLILISTICYFFFLEQLLVGEYKLQAVVIAAPFAISLGLSASLSAIVLACKEYVWAYSAFQFALVVTFLHFFYSTLQVRAVYAIMFAAFAGFGVALGVNSLVLLVLARRFRRVQGLTNSNIPV